MLYKHPKPRLIPCEMRNCFHPAKHVLSFGNKDMNVCDCHYVLDPKECRDTMEINERANHLKDGDCIFCKMSHAKNAMHNLEGKVVFVCDRCYVTPIEEIRHYYRS